MNATEEKIAEILIEKFSIDHGTIKSDTDLKADLGFDSLDAVELIMELENVFKVAVSDEEALNLVTVGDIAKCFEGKL